MNNEMIILIGICCLVFCMVLLAFAMVIWVRRVGTAFQQLRNAQVAVQEFLTEAQKSTDESFEQIMEFILEFAKLEVESREALSARIEEIYLVLGNDGGDNHEGDITAIAPGKLEKGSQEAKERMAAIRPQTPPKGSQEAKDKMAKVRAAKEASKKPKKTITREAELFLKENEDD
jgi:hypothetical protein